MPKDIIKNIAYLSFIIDKSKVLSGTEGKWNSFNTFYVNGASYGGLIGNVNSFVKYIQELLKLNCKLINRTGISDERF